LEALVSFAVLNFEHASLKQLPPVYTLPRCGASSDGVGERAKPYMYTSRAKPYMYKSRAKPYMHTSQHHEQSAMCDG
jgi:hypothetical protein